MENNCDQTLEKADRGEFLPNTCQYNPCKHGVDDVLNESLSTKDRTKFFFNLRYNWRGKVFLFF